MKFSPEQKVKLATGRIGTVKQYKISGFFANGEVVEKIEYYVHYNGYSSYWHQERELSHVYEFDNKFEKGLANLMIDINLDNKDYDMVNNFHTIKQSFK